VPGAPDNEPNDLADRIGDGQMHDSLAWQNLGRDDRLGYVMWEIEPRRFLNVCHQRIQVGR
jgi:hypothetical protein